MKGFDKQIKALAKTFGGLFAAQKVLAFGKASIKAFAADDKAAQILGKSLDNLGVAYANPAVKDFIASLETQLGVLDDQLRPAYQKLLTTTGDWRKSQDLLKTALDLSAMSGSDVVSVAGDLSKAYAGTTRGLMKYGLGLTKTQLAGMKFEDILKQITKISGGQAALAADTYAGSLDKLTVAVQNAKEVIGKGLVQALTEVGGANGFDGALKGIIDFATGISDAIIGLERLTTIAGFFIYNKKGTNPITQMNEFNAKNAKTDMLQRQKFGGAAANAYIATADKNAALKLAKQKKDELNALTAKNKATAEELKLKKDQAALDDLKKKFDLERIGIVAALAKATDDETKARLLAMLAILDASAAGVKTASENLAKVMADKALAEAAATDSLVKLGGAAVVAASSSAALSVAYAKSVGDLNAAMIAAAGVHPSALAAGESGVIGAASIAAEIAAAEARLRAAASAGMTGSNSADARYDAQLAALKAAAEALAAATAAAAATAKITIVDKTSGLIEVVQAAVVDNSRFGNSSFPPGSLLSPI